MNAPIPTLTDLRDNANDARAVALCAARTANRANAALEDAYDLAATAHARSQYYNRAAALADKNVEEAKELAAYRKTEFIDAAALADAADETLRLYRAARHFSVITDTTD